MKRFIAAHDGGCFANGEGTPTYQIFERQADGTYAILNDRATLQQAGVEDNGPVRREKAVERAAQLNKAHLDPFALTDKWQGAGRKLARSFFEKRGKGTNVEVHLSETELAQLLSLAFELGQKDAA